jgi:hypothetical protein
VSEKSPGKGKKNEKVKVSEETTEEEGRGKETK